MAGDWIPLRTELWDCPQVVKIASAICPQNVRTHADRARAKCQILGALYRTWALFDTYTTDGILHGYDAETLDEEVGVDGWSANLQHVGWLVIEAQALIMPEFETWLGHSAKRRLKDAQRKKEERKTVRKTSAICPQNVRKKTDKKRTTEQKRTEHSSFPPPTPSKKRARKRGGGGETGSEEYGWADVTARLAGLEMADAGAAVKAAREAGVTAGYAAQVVDHFEAHRARFTIGALHWRLVGSSPAIPPDEGWPSNDDPAVSAKRRKITEAVYREAEARGVDRSKWAGLAREELKRRGL